jgi:hypothetical protein
MAIDTAKHRRSVCDYAGCHRARLYYTGWSLPNNTVRWGNVCGTHDRLIGRRNLSRMHPSLKRQDIVRLDTALDVAANADMTDPEFKALLEARGLADCLEAVAY